MMRLFLNENKTKTYFSLFVIACLTSFVLLFGLRLTVHAKDYSEYPLYFGLGSNMGYGVHTQLPDVSEFKTYLDNLTGWEGTDLQFVSIYEVSTNYVIFETWSDTLTWSYNGTYPSFGTVSLYCPTACSLVKWDIPSQSFVQYSNGSRNITLSLTSPVSDNTYILHYPYWALSGNIVYNGNTLFVYGSDSSGDIIYEGSSIGGSGSGTFIPSPSNPSVVEGFDFEVNLYYDDSSIKSSIDNLTDKVDTSNNHLSNIWGAISDYFSPPDTDEITETLDNYPLISDLTSTVNDTKSTVNNIFDFEHIQPKTAENVDFDYDFKWKVYVPQLHAFQTRTTTIHIVFSWFESIRTPVTLVLTIFLVLGFLVYVFRQIPNLINGVGAGASAGQSIADMNNNNSSGKGSGKK